MTDLRKTPLLVRWCVAITAGLLMASCSGPQPGALPAINIEAFPAAARGKVAAAHDALLGQPDDAKANGRLAMLAHAHGRQALAIDLYTRAMTLDNDAFVWAYLAALARAETGDTAGAIDGLHSALAIDDGYSPARLRLAEILLREDNLAGSGSAYERVMREQPGSPRAWFGAGQVLLREGNTAGAIEKFAQAVELVPHYGAAHYALAGAYDSLGDSANAELYRRLFDKYKNAVPSMNDPILARVHDLRGSARQAIEKAARLAAHGQLTQAANVFLTLLRTEPDNVVARTNLIGLLGSLGEFERAKSHYDAGVAVAPDDAGLHSNYGILLLRQKRYADAVPAFRDAVAAQPGHAVTHKYLGLCLENLGDNEGALASYQASVEHDPLDHQAGYLLGNMLLLHGNRAAAIATLKRTLEPVSAKTPSYLRALARAYTANGDNDLAKNTLRQARSSASRYGQSQLVTTIDQELAVFDKQVAPAE